jgi:hypothetical protein
MLAEHTPRMTVAPIVPAIGIARRTARGPPSPPAGTSPDAGHPMITRNDHAQLPVRAGSIDIGVVNRYLQARGLHGKREPPISQVLFEVTPM